MPPKNTVVQSTTAPEGVPRTTSTAGDAPIGAGTQELTAYVQGLLQQMQSRFEEMSTSIVSRIDVMGARLDDLEHSIDELMQQAGAEEGDTPGAKPKKK